MRTKKGSTNGTLADRAYQSLRKAILKGEFAEGSFLSEPEITRKYGIGRTPFREACNRLHNEQLLEVVSRRGYFVPEMSFRTVRDLVEARMMLEGMAAELAAVRADPKEVDELERLYKETLTHARNRDEIDGLIEANREFHLQIARMSHNRELETLLGGVLDRATRLVYLVVRSSSAPDRDAQDLLKPIIDAIRRRNPRSAHEAVINDITRGQLNVLGRDLWAAPATLPIEKRTKP